MSAQTETIHCADCCKPEHPDFPFRTRRIVVKESVCDLCSDGYPEWTEGLRYVSKEIYHSEITPEEIKEAVVYLRLRKQSEEAAAKSSSNTPN